jgi:octaprenyl-diphosphate synthase
MTLPLIFALRNANEHDRKNILRIVKNKNHDVGKVREVIDYVAKNGGLEYASSKMDEYRNKALAILNEFPDCEAKESLIELVNYSTTRNL